MEKFMKFTMLEKETKNENIEINHIEQLILEKMKMEM